MKEATGELSMTAIVVVILGLIAVAAPIIINTVTNSLKMKTACQASYGCDTGVCSGGTASTTTCLYVPDDPANAIGKASSSDPGAYEISCSCADIGY